MTTVARQLRDAFVQLDTGAHSALPVASVIATLGRFYLDRLRASTPDTFYGLGPEQDELRDLETIVLAFEALVRAHTSLFTEEYGGPDGFLAWAKEASTYDERYPF